MDQDADWVIRGYQQMVIDRVLDGWKPYFMTFMFRPLPGGQQAKWEQMSTVMDKVYGRVISRMFRNPNATATRPWLPIAIMSPDFPVHKRDKESLVDISINDGLHAQGIWLMPPCETRLEGRLDGHFLNNKEKYLSTYACLAKLDCRRVEETPHIMVDYMFKNLKRGRTAVDNVLILPRATQERHSS